MLSRITRLVALAALSAALVAAAPSAANAEKEKQGSGWIPYEQPDIDYAAGFRCEFAMHGDGAARRRGVQGRRRTGPTAACAPSCGAGRW